MRDWVKWLLVGLLFMAFGVFALANSVAASLAVTTITGVLFLIAGAAQIVAGLSGTALGGRFLAILMGVLMAFLGFSFLSNPLEGAISLAMLVLILLAAGGILRLSFAWMMRQTPYFWPMLLSGAVTILLAAYIGVNFAVVSVPLLGILLGIELLFNGAGIVAMSLFLRSAGGRR
ncbi:MAG: HdeD family acid-resistance protein [Pseudodonghicola sp.]